MNAVSTISTLMELVATSTSLTYEAAKYSRKNEQETTEESWSTGTGSALTDTETNVTWVHVKHAN